MKAGTIGEVVREAARSLASAGIDDAGLDAKRLAAHCLGIDGVGLVLAWQRDISPDEHSAFLRLVSRRCDREPVSRLLGERGFYGRTFALDRHTLDPRPETEVLVETALQLLADTAAPRLLEIGTGSGCLIISILAEKAGATGVGTDISHGALDMTAHNARAHGVSDRLELVETDLASGIEGRFDLMISNPPYIPSSEVDRLEPEVREHDPRGALDGGVDGLDLYRRIVPAAEGLLGEAGALLLEVGQGQAPAVGELLARSFPNGEILIRHDLAGVARCIGVRTARSP